MSNQVNFCHAATEQSTLIQKNLWNSVLWRHQRGFKNACIFNGKRSKFTFHCNKRDPVHFSSQKVCLQQRCIDLIMLRPKRLHFSHILCIWQQLSYKHWQVTYDVIYCEMFEFCITKRIMVLLLMINRSNYVACSSTMT